MSEELNKIKKIFSENLNELPLVLHKVEIKEKQVIISGKIIEIPKLNTKIYPIDNYYKLVTRMIE